MALSNLLPIDKNPASIVLGTMGANGPARAYNFDVEFFVRGLDKDVQKFHYLVTEVDKPKFDLNYDEINQYGYRYQLLTGVRFSELSMTILDDSDNKSISFLYYYLNQIMQGGTNTSFIGTESKFTRFGDGQTTPLLENDPEFGNITALGQDTGVGVVIQEIKLHQYVSYGFTGTANNRIRTWSFQDPQLTNIDMSAFSTTDDEPGTFNLTFNYKNVAFDLTGKSYPDTPFDLLRAAAVADLVEGALTSSPGTYVKAATNIGTQSAISELNTTILPGIAGGGALALGDTLRSNADDEPIPIAPDTSASDKQRDKNGFVKPLSPLQSTSTAKSPPATAEQQAKLDKLV